MPDNPSRREWRLMSCFSSYFMSDLCVGTVFFFMCVCVMHFMLRHIPAIVLDYWKCQRMWWTILPTYFLLFFFCLLWLLFNLSVLSFILCFPHFFFPALVLFTNRRAWTRLPWPMPPFWMAAGAGRTVHWLAVWVLWLSVFLLNLLSLTLFTPQRWAHEDRCWKCKQNYEVL